MKVKQQEKKQHKYYQNTRTALNIIYVILWIYSLYPHCIQSVAIHHSICLVFFFFSKSFLFLEEQHLNKLIEWRSKHMNLLNITIICSYCGDAMKEMNRGIRSFFLFTIYTIQLWNHVRFCFFKSFTERRRCHTNNTYIQRVNIYTLLTQNHSDVRLEGHLIFRDFIEFKRKKEYRYKKIDVIK